ncbi:hypothetical protein Tco_0853498 [Tanacetum coccineum]
MTNMDPPQSTIIVDEPSMNDASENVVVSLGIHHVSFHLHHNHDSVVSQAEQVVSDNGKGTQPTGLLEAPLQTGTNEKNDEFVLSDL